MIGNGWGNFRHLVVSPRQGPLTPRGVTIYAVAQNGDLLWYRHDGDGTADRSGATRWHPNSGNPIGNGWQHFRTVFGGHAAAGASSTPSLPAPRESPRPGALDPPGRPAVWRVAIRRLHSLWMQKEYIKVDITNPKAHNRLPSRARRARGTRSLM